MLLHEAVDALVTLPDGFYVDGTFGRGGHSRHLLQSINSGGHVLGVDKDHAAQAVAHELAESESRFRFFHGSFAELPQQLHAMGGDAVDGILLDLGVSSPQLDDGDRGFSFMRDGPLDMRMDTSRGETAAQWLSRADLQDIAGVLKEYGEERFARRIASAIVAARAVSPIETTSQLARLVSEAHPRWEKHKHPATRSFQAIRIKVNRELEDLQAFLSVALDMLRVGGRLVVISFHSLEDRLVKRFIRNGLFEGEPEKDVFGNFEVPLKKVGGLIVPTSAEIKSNNRARSAKLRIAKKVN